MFRFGDRVENGHASHDNPRRQAFFVRKGVRTGKLNSGPFAELTDGNGEFWEISLRDDHQLTRVAPALPREKEIERSLDNLVDHWFEFGDMMINNQDAYGFDEKVDDAAKLIGRI